MFRFKYSIAIFIVSLLLLLGTATLEHETPSTLTEGMTFVLLCSGVALATYAYGWLGAIIGLGFSAATLAPQAQASMRGVTGEGIACIVTMVVALVARRRIALYQRSESKLRALIASMNDLVLVLDRDGRYVEIGPTAYQLLYLPREHLIGEHVRDRLPPETADLVLAAIDRVLAEKRTIEVDYSLCIGGTDVWFSGSVSPMSTTQVLWVARDITRRKLAEDALHRSQTELEQRVQQRTADLSRTIDDRDREISLRQKAEDALRDSEKRYRGIVEQARDIIFTLDLEGRITSANPAFEQIIGEPAEAWSGREALDLIAGNHQEEARAEIAQVLREGGVRLARVPVRGRDGRRVILEVSLSRQAGEDGFLGLARDTTEREVAERELRRSERMLADAQRVAKIGSWEQDLVSGTIWRSEELCRIEGRESSPHPITVADLVERMPEATRSRFFEAQEALIASGSGEWTMNILGAGGMERILSCRGATEYDSHGKPIRLFGTAQDVTERILVEERLRESEERFRLIARATNDAVWDLELSTGEVWCGEGFHTLFGFESASINPDFWRSRIHPDDRKRFAESLDTAIAAGQDVWSLEYRLRRADGAYANVLDRAYIERDANMRPLRMVGAIMDTTELKQMEEQLAQTRRVNSLGRIAASISHEFNNVLMGMQPNLEVIRSRASADLAVPLDHVLQSVLRGKRITEEILRFTRPADPSLQCVAVDELVTRWRNEILQVVGSKIDVTIGEVPPDLYIQADPLQIAQVLTNLAFNARDAMEEHGGVLEIDFDLAKSFGSLAYGTVKSPDRYVHFSVRDHGIGMPPEHLAQVFEPLFTTKKGGTGLGLAVSYQIVLRHGGLMFAESELGKGTTFHVLLPAASPMVENDAGPLDDVTIEPRRVLIVEDEAAVAFGIQSLLELDGIPTEVVNTGAAAMPAIERYSPDLVILDIGLPDLDGVDVYARIAARWPELPILFSSGHADAAKLGEHTCKPNVGLLIKPYDFGALRREVATLMESKTSGVS